MPDDVSRMGAFLLEISVFEKQLFLYTSLQCCLEFLHCLHSSIWMSSKSFGFAHDGLEPYRVVLHSSSVTGKFEDLLSAMLFSSPAQNFSCGFVRL